MSVIIHDTISLTTASGVSKIQLCIGDITKLPKEEQADVLVVSAFPGETDKTVTRQLANIGANIHSINCSIHPNMQVLTGLWSNLVKFGSLL